MKLYSYTMPKVCDFVPNPYFDYCTLATGRPIVRKCAQRGDWIAVYGSSDNILEEKMVALMQVSEVLTYDAYWTDVRFQEKRPVFDKDLTHTFGDNVYHRVNMQWVQEKSRHSTEDEKQNQLRMKRDVGTNRVLVAEEFFYFGADAIAIPKEYEKMVVPNNTYAVYTDTEQIYALVKYIKNRYETGIHGRPYCGTD